MKTQITLSLFILLIFIGNSLLGQDVIYKRNSETIVCKVKEIGVDQIKYTLPTYGNDLLFSIDKENVKKIVFSDGKEMNFEKELTNPENYADNYRNAIKVDFISPLTGNTTFSFERSIKPGHSWEASLGFIGLGTNERDRDAAGFFTKIGYKFIKSPDFYLRGMRYAHILKGGYVKPELIIGYYSANFDRYDYSNYNYTYYNERRDVLTGGILINLGKQWIYSNSFLVDIYGGVGYGFDSDNEGESYHYGHIVAGEDVPLSLSAGFKIGFLLK
ncbi:MAG: hypothetical protein K9H49_01625 [Bacteroidales bacterium]|nr:hypothetical protein [Bacteroidales bacterium]MCF8404624.1 hypothetical protein [Bacteroidales bacterium]